MRLSFSLKCSVCFWTFVGSIRAAVKSPVLGSSLVNIWMSAPCHTARPSWQTWHKLRSPFQITELSLFLTVLSSTPFSFSQLHPILSLPHPVVMQLKSLFLAVVLFIFPAFINAFTTVSIDKLVTCEWSTLRWIRFILTPYLRESADSISFILVSWTGYPKTGELGTEAVTLIGAGPVYNYAGIYPIGQGSSGKHVSSFRYHSIELAMSLC